ncbi:hypothetical protein [Micromonospora rifamycinica]|uniref:Uncharacterized protein n=1 Tax=Micromonospora rifamycinica TaxID=291594 RepID=A0A1C5IIU5_9ACTN|nr:hypothetical protein [Micromonospora rifamycinica]SCG58290.1 hypothetical protein GA0070623_2603 [Micromonospora rifamycinica]
MRNSVAKPMIAATIALLPVSVLLAFTLDGSVWVGVAAWAVIAAVLLPLSVVIGRLSR